MSNLTTTTLSSPVEVIDSSKERVAYDLAMKIATAENPTGHKHAEKAKNPRKYYLELYGLCLTAVQGRTLPNDL